MKMLFKDKGLWIYDACIFNVNSLLSSHEHWDTQAGVMVWGNSVTVKLTVGQQRPTHLPNTSPNPLPPTFPSCSIWDWGHRSHPMLLMFMLWWGNLSANSSNFFTLFYSLLGTDSWCRPLKTAAHFMIWGPPWKPFCNFSECGLCTSATAYQCEQCTALSEHRKRKAVGCS